MSLAGERLLGSPDDDDREAGIFSTISVPISISRFEPASTSVAQSGTVPLLDGILGDIAPDAVPSVGLGTSESLISSTLRSSATAIPTAPGGSTDLSPSTTMLDS